MRQFILAGNLAYPTALTSVAAGAVAFVGVSDAGVQTLLNASNIADYLKKPINILTVTANEGTKELYYPLFANNFSYTKSVYAAATKYTSKLTIAEAISFVDYTIIVAKKGVKFNERNKWTATIHSGSNDTVTTIAEKLVKHINANTYGSGMTASNEAGVITFTAEKAGVDYEIIPADALMGVELIAVTSGLPATNDTNAIKDMMMKAAADAGFEYTYNDFEGTYPALGGGILDNIAGNAGGYTVYTLKFTEPRMVGTRNDFVNQIVQIAYPTGAGAITTMDSILAILQSGVTE